MGQEERDQLGEGGGKDVFIFLAAGSVSGTVLWTGMPWVMPVEIGDGVWHFWSVLFG